MDLVMLSMRLKTDPSTYRHEYIDELRAYESVLALPSPPIKQIKPVIPFIIKNVHVSPVKSVELLLATLEAVRDFKTRRAVLQGFILLRQRGFLESCELLQHVIAYGTDLTIYLKGCQEFLDDRCYGVLVEWVKKGTEKQKSFCYYFLLILFGRKGGSEISGKDDEAAAGGVAASMADSTASGSMPDNAAANTTSTPVNTPTVSINYQELEGIICEAFFGTSKLTKICLLYFLNRTEITFDISKISRGAEYAKRMYGELVHAHMDRDIKIMKLRVFVLFKGHFKVKCTITGIVLKMIDLEKDDLGALLDCLVSSVERSEAEGVYKVLSDEFVNENKDEDIICYGFNVMREVYYRLAGLEKMSDINCNDLEEGELDGLEEGELDGLEEGELDELEEGELDGLEEEYSADEKTCKSANTKTYRGKANASQNDPFLESLKKSILAYIDPFRGNRTKCIFYAYKMLLKAILKNETIDKPTTFILKPKTKEEREKLRKTNAGERKREIAKEQRERKQKKNRMGRLKNKKNRLLLPTRKKVKRS